MATGNLHQHREQAASRANFCTKVKGWQDKKPDVTTESLSHRHSKLFFSTNVNTQLRNKLGYSFFWENWKGHGCLYLNGYTEAISMKCDVVHKLEQMHTIVSQRDWAFPSMHFMVSTIFIENFDFSDIANEKPEFWFSWSCFRLQKVFCYNVIFHLMLELEGSILKSPLETPGDILATLQPMHPSCIHQHDVFGSPVQQHF